jgi:5-methylcytosine-specific restriction endonuclease McrA
VDHVVPRSLGGPTLPHNWQTQLTAVHYGCNSAKGNGVTTGKGARRPSTKAASRRW